MGNFEKHLRLAKEKLDATLTAFEKNQNTVVGDLGTKIVEQLIEADAARQNRHFGDHKSRHDYAGREFPEHINSAMKKVWFAYGDLGYDGKNGNTAKKMARQ